MCRHVLAVFRGLLHRDDLHVRHAAGDEEQEPGAGAGTLHVVRVQGRVGAPARAGEAAAVARHTLLAAVITGLANSW